MSQPKPTNTVGLQWGFWYWSNSAYAWIGGTGAPPPPPPPTEEHEIFSDNFDDNIFNTDKWEKCSYNPCTSGSKVEEVNQRLEVTVGAVSANVQKGIVAKNALDRGSKLIIMAHVKPEIQALSSSNSYEIMLCDQKVTDVPPMRTGRKGLKWYVINHPSVKMMRFKECYLDGTDHELINLDNYIADEFDLKIEVTATHVKVYKNSILIGESDHTLPMTTYYLYYALINCTTTDYMRYIDTFVVRHVD
jgi:hypothetical protein